MLVDSSPQTSISIAQLLASAVRTGEHRDAITEWLPPVDRIKESKGKRGWEKPAVVNSNAPGRQGGWVARNLAALLRSRDSKVRLLIHVHGIPPLRQSTAPRSSFIRIVSSVKGQ